MKTIIRVITCSLFLIFLNSFVYSQTSNPIKSDTIQYGVLTNIANTNEFYVKIINDPNTYPYYPDLVCIGRAQKTSITLRGYFYQNDILVDSTFSDYPIRDGVNSIKLDLIFDKSKLKEYNSYTISGQVSVSCHRGGGDAIFFGTAKMVGISSRTIKVHIISDTEGAAIYVLEKIGQWPGIEQITGQYIERSYLDNYKKNVYTKFPDPVGVEIDLPPLENVYYLLLEKDSKLYKATFEPSLIPSNENNIELNCTSAVFYKNIR